MTRGEGGGAWPSDPAERLARLSHDLRSPLAVVLGFSEILSTRGDVLDPEERRQFLQHLADGARDLQAILDEERASRPLGPGPPGP
ncbi:MAG TPA: histidine kinase dimerization/phospho-acceptor domain-containing protein [Baekduia sp.]|nr:histidine kinase dimerization/phospho-acceptor domain-containing protein [Baekduia sp.]